MSSTVSVVSNLEDLKKFVEETVKAFGELPESMPTKGSAFDQARAAQSWNRDLNSLLRFLKEGAGRDIYFIALGSGDVSLSLDWQGEGKPSFELSVRWRGNVRPSVPQNWVERVFLKWRALCEKRGADMELFRSLCHFVSN